MDARLPASEISLSAASHLPATQSIRTDEICGIPVKYGALVSENGQSSISVTFTFGDDQITRYASMSSTTTGKTAQENKDHDFEHLIEQIQLISHVFIHHVVEEKGETANAKTIIDALKTDREFTKAPSGEIRISTSKAARQGLKHIGTIKGKSLQSASNNPIADQVFKRYEAMIKSHIDSFHSPKESPAVPLNDASTPNKTPAAPTRTKPPKPAGLPPPQISSAKDREKALPTHHSTLPAPDAPDVTDMTKATLSPKKATLQQEKPPLPLKKATLQQKALHQANALNREFGATGTRLAGNAIFTMLNVKQARAQSSKYTNLLSQAYIGFKYVTAPFMKNFQSTIDTTQLNSNFWSDINDRLLEDHDLIKGKITIKQALDKIIDDKHVFTSIVGSNMKGKKNPDELAQLSSSLSDAFKTTLENSADTRATDITIPMRLKNFVANVKSYPSTLLGKLKKMTASKQKVQNNKLSRPQSSFSEKIHKKLKQTVLSYQEKNTNAFVQEKLNSLFTKFPDYKTNPQFGKEFATTLSDIKAANQSLLEKQAKAIRNKGRRVVYNPLTRLHAMYAMRNEKMVKASDTVKIFKDMASLGEADVNKATLDYNKSVDTAANAFMKNLK